MKKQIGYIVHDDATTNQTMVECQSLAGFFNRNSISNSSKLKSDTQSIIIEGSSNHSYLFMDYNFSECITPQARALRLKQKLTERMPVYGVKAQVPESKRGSNYGELLFCEENDMLGDGFINNVFGGRYITGEESVKLTDTQLKEMIEKTPKVQDCRISDIIGVCSVLEQLCNTLEKNPEARFIILMDDADNCSMDLLCQLYMMLPQKIRLQVGFETNILKSDMDVVVKKGWPLHLFTAEKSTFTELESDRFQIVTCDYELCKSQGMLNKSERLLKLIELAENVSSEWMTYLSYIERKVLEQKNVTASSFAYYFEIVEAVLNPSMYWWSNENIENLEELKEAFDDQQELMNNSQIRMRSKEAFVSEVMQKKYFGDELVAKASAEEKVSNESVLQFLGEHLGLSSVIAAVSALADNMRHDKNEAVESLRQEDALRLQSELEKAESKRRSEMDEADAKLKAELEKAESRRKEESDRALEKLQATEANYSKEIQKRDDRIAGLQQTEATNRSQIASLQQDITNLRNKHSKDTASKDAEIRRKETEVREKQGIIRELETKLGEADYDLQLKYKRQKTVATVFSVIFGLVAVAGITVGFFVNPLAQKQQREMQAQYESEKALAESEKVVVESENAIIESEKAVVEAERDALQAEIDARETEPEISSGEIADEGELDETQMPVSDDQEAGNSFVKKDENEAYDAVYDGTDYVLY